MDKLKSLSKLELIGMIESISKRVGGDVVSQVVNAAAAASSGSSEALKTVQEQLEGNKRPSGLLDDGKNNKGKRKRKRKCGEMEFDKYFGQKYRGLQALDTFDDTIEHHLFQALQTSRLIRSREECNYSRCGRTDKGVSALSQVIALTIRSKLRNPLPKESFVPPARPTDEFTAPPLTAKDSDDDLELDYCYMLNNLLPDDIQIVGWSPAPSLEFSARFKCSSRTYRYIFNKRSLNIALMQEAGGYLQGRHDFRNFCKMDVANVRNFERLIHSVRILPLSNNQHDIDVYCIEVHGQAFLWHQIRCIAGILFLVGLGREPPSVVLDLLDVEKNPRKPCYQIASDLPLILYQTDFGDKLNFKYDARTLSLMNYKFETRWRDLIHEATMLRMSLDFLDQQPLNSTHITKMDLAKVDPAQPKGSVTWGDCPFRLNTQSDYEKGNRMAHLKDKYIPMAKLDKCMTYEDKVASMNDKNIANSNKYHGWNLKNN